MSKSIKDPPVENKPGLRNILKSGTRVSRRQEGDEQKESDTAAEANTEAPSDAIKKNKEPAVEPLSSQEAEALAKCEQHIHGANMSLLQAGKALETISVRRLYRGPHKTFEAYCHDRWGFTPQRADQLIRAATVATAIEESDPGGKLPKPDSEGQLRPLTRLADLSEAPLVWEAAAESADGERITARLVAAAIEDLGCELRAPAKAPPKPTSPGQVVKRINDFADVLRGKVEALNPESMSPDEIASLHQGVAVLRKLIHEIEARVVVVSDAGPTAANSAATPG